MLDKIKKQTILQLHDIGKSKREISDIMQISRNTVKKTLKNKLQPNTITTNVITEQLPSIVNEVFARCSGNAVRIQEILQQEYSINIAYSTLTKLIRDIELRAIKKRAGEYIAIPGEEMQHDTSPHRILIGEKNIIAQCAALVLSYSRKIFMQYYPCFTRFEAKTFLQAALEFMQGCCKTCIVDNTSVILASGSGANAIIAPEIFTFARMYGFTFSAHRVNDPNRKAKVERPFFYIETNFLAGRLFKTWDDLNTQAIQWCNYANQKEKRSLGMTPEAAYIQEKPYLVALPAISPQIYEHSQRLVDSSGFVNLETNRYSAPEKLIGKTIDVYKYPKEVKLFYQHQEVAIHSRLIGKRYENSRLAEHHIRHHEAKVKQVANTIENTLNEYHSCLASYIKKLKPQVRGNGMRALNKLLYLKRTYPKDAVIHAVSKADKYGMYDLNRLEELIIKSVAGNYFNL